MFGVVLSVCNGKRAMCLFKRFFFLMFLVCLPFSSSADEFEVDWDNGLVFRKADPNVELKLSGRMQNDWAFFVSPDGGLVEEFGELEDATEFRRLRVESAGKFYGKLEFNIGYDFSDGENDLKNAYVGLLDLPFGNLRLGHFFEPYGLQDLTSSKYITFLERPLSFAPFRNTGVMVYDFCESCGISWAAGVYRDTDGFGNSESKSDELNYTTRVAGLVFEDEEVGSLLHLGVAYSYRRPNSDVFGVSSRAESHLSPKFISTGELSSDEVQLLNLELAFVRDVFSIQAEHSSAFVSLLEEGSGDLSSWYVEASYFLTGESRSYKAKHAVFGRVKPLDPFVVASEGRGAWELKARYSQADFDDGAIEGGGVKVTSLGVNWYLHSNARLMADLLNVDVKDLGDTKILQTRLAVDY